MNAWKAVVLVLSLAGCDAQHGKDAPLRWAVVKKYDVTSAALERQRQDHPYPPALANANDDRQSRERLRSQVGELRQAALKRCLAMPAAREPVDAPARSQLQSLPVEFVAAARCRNASDGDQLIADLQAKLAALDGLEQQRRQFDQDLTKNAERAATEAVEAFARDQGYQLIIGNDGAVMYNEGKAVVDVTAAVVEAVRGH